MVKNITVPASITPELAEETGWHIGDGSMNFYNRDGNGKLKGIYQLRGHIEDDREHYTSRIKPIFKLLYDIDISLREMPSTRVFGFQIWNDKLVKFKQNLGLPLGKKFNIVIPEAFLIDDNIKIAVIRGIFDTDGCVYLQPKYNKLYPRLEIGTISKSLGQQIQKIFIELGLRATVHLDTKGKKDSWLQVYKISIRGTEMFDRFMKIIKPANPKHIRKYNLFKESFK
jgi:DNA-binding transcriptional regulator WhiA